MKMLEIDQNELLQIKEEVIDEEETETPECDLNLSAQVKKESSVDCEPEGQSLTENQVQQVKDEELSDIEFYEEPEFKFDISGNIKTDPYDPIAIRPEPTDPESVNEAVLDSFQCEYCLQNFTMNGLAKHMNEDCSTLRPAKTGRNPKTFPCQKCGREFKRIYNLLKHRRLHTGKVPYSCDECGMQFYERRLFLVHCRNHIRKNPYVCLECKKRFPTQALLNDHQKLSHPTGKFFPCDECEKRYAYKGSLVTHKKRIHQNKTLLSCEATDCGNEVDLKSFQCEYCLQNFTFEGINKHVNGRSTNNYCDIQRNLGKFQCKKCRKRFQRKESLTDHELTHTGEKPFLCHECGKRFINRNALTGHKRIHTGEKPYACDECGKRFSHHQNRSIHKRYHTGERPFSCDICGKGFVAKSVLCQHIYQVHTKEKLRVMRKGV